MKRIIVEIEVTDSMYNAFGYCGEDADCEDCECRIGYDDCIFNHKIIDSKELLVILPVAPGETVYLIDNNTNACDECEKFHRGEHAIIAKNTMSFKIVSSHNAQKNRCAKNSFLK